MKQGDVAGRDRGGEADHIDTPLIYGVKLRKVAKSLGKSGTCLSRVFDFGHVVASVEITNPESSGCSLTVATIDSIRRVNHVVPGENASLRSHFRSP